MFSASEIAAVIGIILCVILNLMVIIVYGYKRRSIKVGEIQLVSLALSDFLQAGTGYALQLYAYNTPSEIGTWACKASGFCVTFLSLVSISHLVALSCERYITVIHPYKAYVWFYKKKTSLYFIIPAWAYGFLWAALPLVGWSSYSREQGAEHRCNINLYTYDDHHLSYTYTLLFFCFVVPLISLIYCQVRVRMEVRINLLVCLSISKVLRLYNTICGNVVFLVSIMNGNLSYEIFRLTSFFQLSTN